MTIDIHDYQAMVEAQQTARRNLDQYEGDFAFMHAMKDLASDPDYIFTEKQLAAIQRTFDAALRFRQPKPANTEDGLTVRVLNSGKYAILDNPVIFLKVDVVEKGNWKGWVFVKRISGPNEFRIGKQRPGGFYEGSNPEWIDALNSTQLESMKRYGQLIGECGYCGLRLTDEVSRAFGIGPICRKNIGI